MEAKMALVEIVRNFKIELAPETEVPIFVYMDCVYGSVQIRISMLILRLRGIRRMG